MFRLIRCIVLLAVLTALAFFFHGAVLTRAGQMIVRSDELKPADAIVVLAGEPTERVAYGVKLYKEGWARKDLMVMAGGPLVWKHSWASLMKEHAESLGVPADRILLEDSSRSTEEDALYTRDVLKKHHIGSIILVTSPYHSRRAAIIFGRVLGKDVTVVNAPVTESWFHTAEWWKRRRDRAMVLNEFSKYTWLWLFGIEKRS